MVYELLVSLTGLDFKIDGTSTLPAIFSAFLLRLIVTIFFADVLAVDREVLLDVVFFFKEAGSVSKFCPNIKPISKHEFITIKKVLDTIKLKYQIMLPLFLPGDEDGS